ncbi:Glutamate-ammonia-ligase adenylyltransferase [uncultured Desulfobacterium sp.]|uniref:Glutamate-ammonia-ligase adenylyltransferase n=1 Tax=uncultured Desulfobacterium sp. TaxID=201089 RepID=A0A445MQQ1_9BACT|nr:Glutamate-ammonia-ligase adenylyltransferase [uncultured Desulfobacterium sp.]
MILPEKLEKDYNNKWDEFSIAAQKSNIALPGDLEILSRIRPIFALSDFVANSCIINPDILNELILTGDLKKRYGSAEFADRLRVILSPLTIEKNETLLLHLIRRLRLREMVRIAWRDLASWAELSETMTDLSGLADAVIDHTLSVLYHWQCMEYGIPLDPDGQAQQLVVIGMGKLGGLELNFSSDVDLIFAYPADGMTTRGPVSLSNQEFFARLCQRMINAIGTKTADGIAFRVDMRLRPFGEGGPLVMSFDAMEAYYQDQGREWERYAWIKARSVAGDIDAGNRLIALLNPFVYRRYLDFGAFESMRDMKHKISLEVRQKAIEDNIKLGPGGIREIEFFGQIFQLIRGGVLPALQTQGIQQVLKILEDEGYISQDVCNGLMSAYEFLRNTENRLQEFSDQQIHQLPGDELGKERLALSMGFEDWESFAGRLKLHMDVVHGHFSKLLGPEESREATDQKQGSINGLKAVWHDIKQDEGLDHILIEAGYTRPKEVVHLLANLRNSSATKSLSSKGRTRLDKLMPLLLKETGRTNQPETVLNRIIELIKAIQGRTTYLALLLENPSALIHLFRLISASSWIASLLSRYPVLLDELLDPRTLYSPPDKTQLMRQIKMRIERAPSDDLEYQMIELCIFRQVNTLRVAAADVTETLPLMRVSDHLTEIAETVLSEVLDLSWQILVKRHGSPAGDISPEADARAFAIIGYGKLGGIELGYGSDLDLVFIHHGQGGETEGGEQPIDDKLFYTRLGQKIIHILTTANPAGVLYETDMRLRPDGSSGILVVDIEAFREYQEKKAWTWEHQALIKARPICGDRELIKRFEDIRQGVLVIQRDEKRLREDIAAMRERMRMQLHRPRAGTFDIKQGEGGIVDIEFLVQYLALLHAHGHHEIIKWTDNVRLLETMAGIGIIDNNTHRILKETYLTYRSAVHRLSLEEKPAMAGDNEFADQRHTVVRLWDEAFKTP